MRKQKGFTLIELLVVIGIMAILATVVLVAINPSRQFKLARDSERTANVATILNAIGQNISENKGIFLCGEKNIVFPSTETIIKSDNGTGGLDIGSCLVPTYISSLPFDPNTTGAHYTNSNEYDTKYSIVQDANGRLTVSAKSEIGTSSISATR